MAITLNIPPSAKTLHTQSFVGFDGSINGGLCRLKNSNSIVFAIGPTVVIRDVNNWSGEGDQFLTGHTGTISAIACSPDGTRVASGQVAHLGFHATVCIFDVATGERVHSLNLHRGQVSAIAWSPCGKYVASLGGKDDNSVVVWDAELGRPVCGGPAAAEPALCIAFYNTSSTRLVTAGTGGIRLWEIDVEARRATPRDVPLAGLTRVVRCLVLSQDDSTVFAGTTSGDVLAVQIAGPIVLKAQGPAKRPLSQGVTSLALAHGGQLIAGSGEGKVVVLSPTLQPVQSATLNGAVTSMVVDTDGYWCGTDQGCVYSLSRKTFKEDLRLTCHSSRVNAVVFPSQSSAVFATCSGPDIRVWRTSTGEVLLRLTVPGLECNCLTITADGTQILSGWSDGTVRAFGPESGRFLYIVHDAHKTSGIKRLSGSHQGVTAIAGSPDSARMVTGGADGQVRLWSLRQEQRVLEASLKEHKGTVNAIAVSPRLPEVASASDDGTVILWDLVRRVRRNVIYAQTYFRSAQYLFDGSQLLATGSDRRISFYDSNQCDCIRSLEGAKKGDVAALAIAADGSFFVSGGADGILKLWDYDEGTVKAVANGAHVTSVRHASVPR